jgi:hypothetical protein
MAADAHLPRRIILSRKGWDTNSGGGPSPIFEDRTLLSLPIPDPESGVRFRDLRSSDSRIDVSTLVADLTRRKKKKINGQSELHLDPDLREDAIRRGGTFQPAFGQSGGQQTHLHRNKVGKDDLFLFFGLFRQVAQGAGRWHYVPRTPTVHVIFGWLQVGEILCLSNDKVPDSLTRHPHAVLSSIVRKEGNNTIYLPRERLTFSQLLGSGLFEAPFSSEEEDPRRISKRGQTSTTQWQLPSFFEGLSNMGEQPKSNGQFWEPRRTGYGQEFVLDVTGKESKAEKWLGLLFQRAKSK